jgi:hypothetical protein
MGGWMDAWMDHVCAIVTDAWMDEGEREVYKCSSRPGLIEMDHRQSGNGRNSQQ